MVANGMCSIADGNYGSAEKASGVEHEKLAKLVILFTGPLHHLHTESGHKHFVEIVEVVQQFKVVVDLQSK